MDKQEKIKAITDALNNGTPEAIGDALLGPIKNVIDYKYWAEKILPYKVYEGKGFSILFYKSKKMYQCNLVYSKAYSASKYFESVDVTECYNHMLKWDKIELEDYLNLLKLTNENSN